MRAVVVAAALFLVVLMSMPDSGAGWLTRSWKRFCRYKVPDIKCKNGWRKLDADRCIKVFSAKKSMGHAENYCLKLGGNLVSILNRKENDIVTCEMIKSSHRMKYYWIGAMKRKNKFSWRDGSGALKYTRWGWHQPDNWGGKENCVDINFRLWGRWNDDGCWKKHRFVCQKMV